MADVPHGPIIASIIIAAVPFIIYFLWKKSLLRTYFIGPVVTLLYRIYYGRKEREIDSRIQEEYEGFVGKKIEMKDILKYGSYVGMFAMMALILKKAFLFSLVVSGSMMPTLMASDLVLIETLTMEKIEVGDIVSFNPPGRTGQLVVHRVISVSDDGKIKTKGDNAGIDGWTLGVGNIEGKVVTVNNRPVVIKNIGAYFMPKNKIYLLGTDPIYEGIQDSIRWIHGNGPIILIVLLLIIILSNFESKKKYEAYYE